MFKLQNLALLETITQLEKQVKNQAEIIKGFESKEKAGEDDEIGEDDNFGDVDTLGDEDKLGDDDKIGEKDKLVEVTADSNEM